jgi:hypothetical protein
MILAFSLGCSMKAAEKTDFMKGHDIQMNRRQAQIELYGFTMRACGLIEVAASEIESAAEEKKIQQRARLWKIHAIPAYQKAAFQADPLVGYIDSAALSLQMLEYLDSGLGRDRFGAQQPIAVQAAHEIVAAMVEAGADYYQRDKEAILEWAAGHPFDNHLFVRTDATATLAAEVSGGQVGALQAAAEMGEQMNTLNDRMGIYSLYAPRQIQWQTDFVLAQSTELIDEQTGSVLEQVMGQSTFLLDGIEGIIDRQADSLMAGVGGERYVILEALRAERALLLQTLQEERRLILEAVRAEREAALTQMGDVTLGIVGPALKEGQVTAAGVVDHLFLRAAMFLVVPFLIVLVGVGWIVRTLFRQLNERNQLLAASIGGAGPGSASETHLRRDRG